MALRSSDSIIQNAARVIGADFRSYQKKTNKYSRNVMSRPRQNLIGMNIGYWTVLEPGEDIINKTGRKRVLVCKCSCGRIKSVLEQNLISRKSLSCGCRQKEIASSYKKAYWQELGSKMRSTDGKTIRED